MELHGSTASNLLSACKSARRLRTHPVHADTLAYWSSLVHLARRELAGVRDGPLLSLTTKLEAELADRST
jgi:hypothetical protein